MVVEKAIVAAAEAVAPEATAAAEAGLAQLASRVLPETAQRLLGLSAEAEGEALTPAARMSQGFVPTSADIARTAPGSLGNLGRSAAGDLEMNKALAGVPDTIITGAPGRSAPSR